MKSFCFIYIEISRIGDVEGMPHGMKQYKCNQHTYKVRYNHIIEITIQVDKFKRNEMIHQIKCRGLLRSKDVHLL